ncbi:hypothetical protein [Flavobacterium silvaticum]|uniref:Phosphate ABC transporter substrate-binding protein n=1 Tax=Flavobacterium silvaticum TaxID=1852020 RepID=A0A972FJY1_9FLAO|nr:hypothetical protein [Flavobacterium silvaticum]NMH26590.1 hypothetical protein [Flavobacterium silvaticum]
MERTSKLSYIFSGKSAFLKYGFIMGCLLFAMQGKAQTLTAIGNVSGTPSDMKQSELKAVLMGETQRWKSGKRIVIALMKTNTPLGKTTSSKIYDMSGDELNKYWLSLVFQGKAQAPVFFTSVTELQNFVAQNPGAIGIIDKPVANAEVRSVMIDGKSSF